MTRIRRSLVKLGLPRLQVTVAGPKRAAIAAEAVIDKLIADAQIDALRALIAGDITLAQLVDLDRQSRLSGSGVLAAVALNAPLWPTLDRLFGDHTGRGGRTRQRYHVSARALREKATRWLPAAARVEDLRRVPWTTLHDGWDRSSADWNHLRRMLSRTLTLLVGKQHPARYELLAPIPRASEQEREPNITPAAFWRIVQATREDVRASFVTLALSGMRVGEYLACTPAHLEPPRDGDDVGLIRVPGTKTTGSAARVAVAASHWHYVAAAIPAPLRYKRLRAVWLAACEATGHADLHLHDLRHLSGQLASDAGLADSRIQPHLRHATAAMTRRYSKRHDKRAVADAIANQLGGPDV